MNLKIIRNLLLLPVLILILWLPYQIDSSKEKIKASIEEQEEIAKFVEEKEEITEIVEEKEGTIEIVEEKEEITEIVEEKEEITEIVEEKEEITEIVEEKEGTIEITDVDTSKTGDEYATEPKEIPGYYMYKRVSDTDKSVVQYDYIPINESMINPDFEEPVLLDDLTYDFFDASVVPGWNTTASDNMIEFGTGPAHDNMFPASGNQFVELNGNVAGELYQLVSYKPGTILRWRLSHAGRRGIDTMRLSIGSPDNPTLIDQMSSPSGKWTEYKGTYNVPTNQLVTYFGFEAYSSSTGNITLGNLLDNIFFGENSELLITNQVDKDLALQNDILSYSINIKNTGGVPADRFEIIINGLEDIIPDKNSFKLGNQTISADEITVEDGRVFYSPNMVLPAQESIELNFKAQIKRNPNYEFIKTQVEITHWDELFDDTNFSNVSNQAVTQIISENNPVVDPLDPETEIDPENKPELPEIQGLVSIDFVSQFNFGEVKIDVEDRRYDALPQRLLSEEGTVIENEERPNFVQISDQRSDLIRGGWSLSATLSNTGFVTAQNEELRGAQIILKNQQLVTAQKNTSMEPTIFKEGEITLQPGVGNRLLDADSISGSGTWIYRFGDIETAATSVQLEVPKGSNPKAVDYIATIRWELSVVPGN